MQAAQHMGNPEARNIDGHLKHTTEISLGPHGLNVKRWLCKATRTRTPLQYSRSFMNPQMMSRSNGLTDCLNFVGGRKRAVMKSESAIYLSS
jgi:hypothetical protein